MAQIQTTTQLADYFYEVLKSINPNLSPDIQGTDSYFKANAFAALVACAIQSSSQVANNQFAVSSSSPYQDKIAAELGMSPRAGALPTSGTVYLYNPALANTNLTPNADYTISAGTTLTGTTTGVSYYTLDDVILTNGTNYAFDSDGVSTIALSIQSSSTGTDTVSPASTSTSASLMDFGTSLTISTGSGNVTISQSYIPTTGLTPGSNIQSDSSFAYLIYKFMQYPRGGGSAGDYFDWCRFGSRNVTDAEIIYSSNGTNNILYPVVLSGNNDNDYYIDGDSNNDFQQSPNNRASTADTISAVQSYIDGVRPINDSPDVISANTYYVINDSSGNDNINWKSQQQIQIVVSLADGINLDTLVTITNADDSTQQLTAQNLILRELRRGIVDSTPYGTELFYDENSLGRYILIDNLQAIILEGLGNTNNLQGNYAAIVNSISITYSINSVANDYIQLPDIVENGQLIYNNTAVLAYDINITDTIGTSITISAYTGS